jgi:hypothetical protein
MAEEVSSFAVTAEEDALNPKATVKVATYQC